MEERYSVTPDAGCQSAHKGRARGGRARDILKKPYLKEQHLEEPIPARFSSRLPTLTSAYRYGPPRSTPKVINLEAFEDENPRIAPHPNSLFE